MTDMRELLMLEDDWYERMTDMKGWLVSLVWLILEDDIY